MFVLPCNLQNKDRPISTTARQGFEEFISRCRRAANDDSLHPLKIRTDNGSEFVGGACKVWLNARRVDHPGFYEHSTTTGSRSAGNPFAERAIQSWRRLLYAQYRAVEKQWDEQAVPRRQRRVLTGYHTVASSLNDITSADTTRSGLNQRMFWPVLTQLTRRRGIKSRVHQMQHAKTGLLSCVIKVSSPISKRFISKL